MWWITKIISPLLLTFVLTGCNVSNNTDQLSQNLVSPDNNQEQLQEPESESEQEFVEPQRQLSIEEYRQNLQKTESQGGELFCENNRNQNVRFNNCEEYQKLHNQNCFPLTTYDMAIGESYEATCSLLNIVSRAKPAKKDYFQLDSPDWWKQIPAKIIPLPGGIWTEETRSNAETTLQQLTHNKRLGDLDFYQVIATGQAVDLILNSSKENCGAINDTITLYPKLLADFDNDGIAELLIQSSRRQKSESCPLGSSNILGGSLEFVLKKSDENQSVSIMKKLK